MCQCHGQGRINWWCHRYGSRCCRCHGSEQTVPFFPRSYGTIPSLPCRLHRYIRRYVLIKPGPNCTSLETNHAAAAVIAADRASAQYDIEHTPEKKRQIEREKEREALYESNKSALQRAKDWATANRYPLLFGFWVASMAGSWHMVNRNPYLSGSQKLVQARMYAQGGTLAALLGSFAIEGADAAKGKGRWETIRVIDPNDPEHKHMIEKKIHHERYAGEDQWRGMLLVYCMQMKLD